MLHHGMHGGSTAECCSSKPPQRNLLLAVQKERDPAAAARIESAAQHAYQLQLAEQAADGILKVPLLGILVTWSVCAFDDIDTNVNIALRICRHPVLW